jgi:hypothetical protein
MIYKRGKVYWYKFMWQGKLVRESSKQGNDRVARNMESAHRTSLAKGEVGIREKKPSPPLAIFLKDRILPWRKPLSQLAAPRMRSGIATSAVFWGSTNPSLTLPSMESRAKWPRNSPRGESDREGRLPQ